MFFFAGSFTSRAPDTAGPPEHLEGPEGPDPLLVLEEDLTVGASLDVLDLYSGKKTHQPMQKWEPCRIVDVRPGAIYVRDLLTPVE